MLLHTGTKNKSQRDYENIKIYLSNHMNKCMTMVLNLLTEGQIGQHKLLIPTERLRTQHNVLL